MILKLESNNEQCSHENNKFRYENTSTSSTTIDGGTREFPFVEFTILNA